MKQTTFSSLVTGMFLNKFLPISFYVSDQLFINKMIYKYDMRSSPWKVSGIQWEEEYL